MQLLLQFIDLFQQSNAIFVGTGELSTSQLVAVFNGIKLCLQVRLILLVPAISNITAVQIIIIIITICQLFGSINEDETDNTL